MTNKELAERFTEIKKQVTLLGHEYLSGKMPIEIDVFKKISKPFAKIENVFIKEIKKLNK